jgi:hypothetical protein
MMSFFKDIQGAQDGLRERRKNKKNKNKRRAKFGAFSEFSPLKLNSVFVYIV